MGKNQQKYSVADMRLAIEEVQAVSYAAVAERLHCSKGTVTAYLRRFPELKARFEALRGTEVQNAPQYPKELFEAAIKESYGIKANVYHTVKCSRQTFENAIKRWPDLADQLEVAGSNLMNIASNAMVNEIKDPESKGHTSAWQFVMRTKGKDEGFVERKEVTGADGKALFPEDIAKQLAERNLDGLELLRQFLAMPTPLGA